MSDQEKAELAERNVPLIWYVVNRYTGASVECDELYSAALFGMARALSAYDETRGIRFSTFAVICMNHEILNLLKAARKRKMDISYDICILSPDNGDVIRDESFIGRMTTISLQRSCFAILSSNFLRGIGKYCDCVWMECGTRTSQNDSA